MSEHTPAAAPRETSRLLIAWCAVGLGLCGLAALLAAMSQQFDYAVPLASKPALILTFGMGLAGAIYALLLPLIRRTIAADLGAHTVLFAIMLGVGLALRVMMFRTHPALEDDWYRYLWDGAVTAHGYNPFAVAPDDAQGNDYAGGLQALAHASGVIIERINHSDLKTIYPAGAQAAFALAYLIGPWNLDAWRLVCLGAEITTLVLILALLAEVGRARIWAALYWWNPLVVKELMNSAHMEAVLMPVVVGSVLIALKGRRVIASGLAGLAVSVKLWPVILLPILTRPLWGRWPRLFGAAILSSVVIVLFALPPLLGGIDETSGFRAYAEYWQTNNAIFPQFRAAVQWALGPWNAEASTTAFLARFILAATLAVIVCAITLRPIGSKTDETRRITLIITALILLSPAQFPWYLVWVLPFACLHPWRGFFAATTLLPGYYASFHFLAQDRYDIFSSGVVWLIWCPIWLCFLWDTWEGWTTREGRHA